ncbi:MAG: hypothetical protein SFZ02_12075 [bacterium]|nr:hypothetical protein [bacterium]
MKKEYDNILTLLEKELVTNDDHPTSVLINSLAPVHKKGYFTQYEFLEMCKWKEPRQRKRKYWQANTEEEVKMFSTKAFSTQDEARRILTLCRLKGVGVPVASAILTLTNPTNYGVIDIRVWQVLYTYNEVDYDKDGENIKALHWLDYLEKIRDWANQFNTSARLIEQTLFKHHEKILIGPLYPNEKKKQNT